MNTLGSPGKRFAVDIMLGKLAKWLRVLGFDAIVLPLHDRAQIESCLSREIIPITRREKWQSLRGVLFIHSDHHFEQLQELVARLNLEKTETHPFSRCAVCNEVLYPISRDATFGNIPDFVFETASDFRKCPKCGRIYWPGTHKNRMIEKLESLFDR